MQIQCTKKILDELKIKAEPRTEENSLSSWHGNLLKLGRKKVLVLMNDVSRYAVVLFGLKAKDLKNIDKLIMTAIRETFKADGIHEEVIEKYMEQAGNVIFTKTKDRTSVARLNQICGNVEHFYEFIDEETVIQTPLTRRINDLLAGDGKGDYITPDEEMYKHLEEFAGRAVFQMEAVQLKVTLTLSNHSVWRRVVVPATTTFDKLHEIIQAAFEWQDSHLHEFAVYEAGKGSNVAPISEDRPLVVLVPGGETYGFERDVPVDRENDVRLTDILPARIIYKYDFGDDWEHVIEAEGVIDDYEKNHPLCLEGEGAAPPEDVGGEPGYENFLQIIGDKSDPDYEHMQQWGREQGYRDFKKDDINRMLKRL